MLRSLLQRKQVILHPFFKRTFSTHFNKDTSSPTYGIQVEEKDNPRLPKLKSVRSPFRPPMILALTEEIISNLERSGYLRLGRPTHNPKLLSRSDEDIIKHYARLTDNFLKYSQVVDNGFEVKKLANHDLRYSCLFTLACKHRSTLSKTIKKYGQYPSRTFLKVR